MSSPQDDRTLQREWISEARRRLAQKRGKKPETKAGQIRALWPEIEAVLAVGQSLRTVRQWLEDEAGVIVTVQSLGSYLTRIRRKGRATSALQASGAPEPEHASSQVTTQPSTSGAASPVAQPAFDPLANIRERTKKRPGFEYPPGPPDESKLI